MIRTAFTIAFGFAMGLGVAPSLSAAPEKPTDKAARMEIAANESVESLFTDFLHYARLGRFTAADAYAKALLVHPELDPVELSRFANRDRKSLETLLIIIENSSIGESALAVLKMIEQGENLQRQDSERIEANIALLGGDPQQEFIATGRLADSGEYAIAAMVQALQDPARSRLVPRIVAALPRLGKAAVNPLVMALNTSNDDVRLHVARALGDLGYPQSIPYLLRVSIDESLPNESRAAARQALLRIEEKTGRSFPGSPDVHFFRLGERYFHEDDVVRADPRLDQANLWYWDSGTQTLIRTVAPTAIFGSVMAMRCAEESLQFKNDSAEAIALWLAANFRREHRLGLSVESDDPLEKGVVDPTRPEVFPRALYFAQAAGPRYAHLVLRRAVDDQDSAVALGAIRSLRITAGESSLIGSDDDRQPLVQALRFPDPTVRIRAALALGAALPRSQFADSQFVIPVLASALGQSGRRQAVIVDANEQDLNRVAGVLRTKGYDVVAGREFFGTMDRARTQLASVSAILLATDLGEPGTAGAMQALQGEFLFSKTPVVLLVKPGQELMARQVASGSSQVSLVDADASEEQVESAVQRATDRAASVRLDEKTARATALEAIDVLQRIALDGRTVYFFEAAEPALIGVLGVADEELQRSAATVLSVAGTPTAQRAIAHIALDAGQPESLRASTFSSLAESAKRNGSMLEEAQITELVRISKDEKNLVLRTAASEALGAMNLTANRASEIIRSFHGG